ncbi:hypothetical protein ACOSQ3_014578 [Xanthoceras sorbifolium]
MSSKASSSRGSRFEILDEDMQDGQDDVNPPVNGKLLEALTDITNSKDSGSMKAKGRETSTKNKIKPKKIAKSSSGGIGLDSRPKSFTPINREKATSSSKKKSAQTEVAEEALKDSGGLKLLH